MEWTSANLYVDVVDGMTMNDYQEKLDIDIKRVGAQIREVRIARGLSQTELANRIGIRQPIISRVENGTHVPTWRNLKRIANELGVELVLRLDY